VALESSFGLGLPSGGEESRSGLLALFSLIGLVFPVETLTEEELEFGLLGDKSMPSSNCNCSASAAFSTVSVGGTTEADDNILVGVGAPEFPREEKLLPDPVCVALASSFDLGLPSGGEESRSGLLALFSLIGLVFPVETLTEEELEFELLGDKSMSPSNCNCSASAAFSTVSVGGATEADDLLVGHVGRCFFSGLEFPSPSGGLIGLDPSEDELPLFADDNILVGVGAPEFPREEKLLPDKKAAG
jgi:hypothetical protein